MSIPRRNLLTVLSIGIEDFEKAKKGSDYMGDVFVIFKVVTNVHEVESAIAYGVRSSEVWHRYSEFDLLYQYLLHTYPSHIIPPLPEKKISTNLWTKMTTDKFDGEYLEHRKIGLEKFMHRIASHPVLHKDIVFKAFLMKGEDWRAVADSTEFRAKAEGVLKGIQASYQLKNCDSRFTELKIYADELETRVNAILRVTAAIAQKQRSCYNSYKDFAKTFSEWSVIEKGLKIPLQKIGHNLDNLEGAGNVLLLEEEMKFYENLKEYANYACSLRDFIRKYELLQYKVESLEATIESKKAGLFLMGKPEAGEDVASSEDSKKNLSNLFKMTPAQKEARRSRLQQELSEAEGCLDPAKQDLEQFCTEADEELKLWKEEKLASLKTTFRIYAKLQLQHCQQGLQCWQAVSTAAASK